MLHHILATAKTDSYSTFMPIWKAHEVHRVAVCVVPLPKLAPFSIWNWATLSQEKKKD